MHLRIVFSCLPIVTVECGLYEISAEYISEYVVLPVCDGVRVLYCATPCKLSLWSVYRSGVKYCVANNGYTTSIAPHPARCVKMSGVRPG